MDQKDTVLIVAEVDDHFTTGTVRLWQTPVFFGTSTNGIQVFSARRFCRYISYSSYFL